MNNGHHVTLDDLAREARRRRRGRMARKAAWWAAMLGIAVFLGWWVQGWLNAMRNW